jgi:uncharacterized protein (TIGR00369 family)
MPSLKELQDFIDANLNQVHMRVESLGEREAVFTCVVGADDIGHGNAVSGPAIMKMVDTAFYLVLLGELGFDSALAASSLNFSFLRKPPGDQNLRGHCRLLKVGRRLIVGEMTIYSEGDERPVAHAIGTYTPLGG